MSNTSNFSSETETTISSAFRSPPADALPQKSESLRLRVEHDTPLSVKQIRPSGMSAVWGLIFPNATVLELSGRIELKMLIYPSHVQIEKRRWTSSTNLLARFSISIPIYDEIGDQPVHQLVIHSALAFLYPFVPMHVQVALDDEVVFSQGKYDARKRATS